MPPLEQKFVLYSTITSRNNGYFSVQAITETILAVVAYWGIAIYFDTHWHLVTSLFVAPLLLLRSKISIEKGVRWFLKDWFGLKNYEPWSNKRKFAWIAFFSVCGFATSLPVSTALAEMWLVGNTDILTYIYAAIIGGISVCVGVAVVGAASGEASDASAAAVAGAVAGATVGAATAAIAIAVKVVNVVAGVATFVAAAAAGLAVAFAFGVAALNAFVVTFAFMPYGIGLALRALFFRFLATLLHLFSGVRALPKNWVENNFVIDSRSTSELIPGIRGHVNFLSMDGLLDEFSDNHNFEKWVFYPILTIVWFVPAFLYRFNIKATCWFYWPLFFLLRPLPDTEQDEKKQYELCWPQTNPAQRWLIILVSAWLLLSILAMSINKVPPTDLSSLSEAIPVWIVSILGIDLNALAPWHCSQLAIGVFGISMLFLAGKAVAKYRAGIAFHDDSPWVLPVMHGLWRLRSLAVIASLVMTLGALVIYLQSDWVVLLPSRWGHALREFYQLS